MLEDNMYEEIVETRQIYNLHEKFLTMIFEAIEFKIFIKFKNL